MSNTVKVPDGKGGFVDITAERVAGQTANQKKQQAALDAQLNKWTKIGTAAERFNKYLRMYGNDYNLTREELAQALYLEILNWKEFWPADLGGPAHFDTLSKEVWDWFQENKTK
jgi:hypothetical protein